MFCCWFLSEKERSSALILHWTISCCGHEGLCGLAREQQAPLWYTTSLSVRAMLFLSYLLFLSAVQCLGTRWSRHSAGVWDAPVEATAGRRHLGGEWVTFPESSVQSSCETCAFSEAKLCSSDAQPAGLRLLWNQHQISAQVMEQQLWVPHMCLHTSLGPDLSGRLQSAEMHMPACDACAQIQYLIAAH